MSTTNDSTPLSNAATAVAVRNRLSRDLDELRRAAGANTLPTDDNGVLFDLSISLGQALTALTTAIANVERYIADAQRAEYTGALSIISGVIERLKALGVIELVNASRPAQSRQAQSREGSADL